MDFFQPLLQPLDDLVVHQKEFPLFTHDAQIIVAIGLAIFFVFCGVAKIIKGLK